mmetsp:Transcript_29114/g.62736  ORF Transcript_29114/g.62736 Transcript_29114/m.62736 type:complete len:234 (-) Transcript_29114:618-1319(-)
MGVSSWIAILFIVRVPVLSEQSIFIPAMSSIAARRVTIAPCLESSLEPRASVVVHTISMATGMEATISTTVKEMVSVRPSPEPSSQPNTIPEKVRDRITSTMTIFSSTFCRLPISSSPCSREAVLPKKVLPPVNSTVPSTSPRTTVEPILQLLPLYMVTGRDSPVSADWSTSMVPSFTTQSAGIADPEASRTKSPGTTVPASMFNQAPSRFAVARGFSDAFRAATASPALVIS